jgi:hypothetical protein
MKKLDLAYEIIKESKKTRALYLESGRDYHKVAAHMYSIFECYAHGLISWNSVRSYWHNSNLEYLNLYKDNETLYVAENNRMLAEYENTLKRFKPALDEYKKVSEAKMTSNIVVKNQISESVAKEQSNLYYNKRNLSESAVKEIAHIADWKQVVESYPNLTANDKDRLRMLTIFENDTFNVTGWSQLNEGPTLDTTQMITTVMSEAPTPTMNPEVIRKATAASSTGMPNQRPGMVGSIVGGQIGRMAGSAIAGPVGGMVGRAIGSEIGTRVGTNMANKKSNAPAASARPMPRPMAATEEAPKTSIRPVARPGRSLPGGGYEWPGGAVEPGAGAKFMTDIPGPKARPDNLTKSNTPAAGSNLAPTTSIRPQRRPASNVGRREMSPTPGVMDGSTRGFESVQKEGYKTIKSIDKERYDEIPGLEGPFMTLSGKVVYYDPKEGSYYDRDTDMYLSYEEFKELDNDYSGMKNTRDMKEDKATLGAAVNRAEQKRQVAIRKAKAWMKRTGKGAADAAREFDLLKGDISKLEESTFNEAVEKIACVKCDEVSTAKAWEKNNGFCPKCKTSNQGVAESSDYAKRRKAADDEYYGKNLTDTKADWRSDKSATAKNWSHNKLMKVAKHDRSAEKEIKRRIASKEYVFANEEVELDEAEEGTYMKQWYDYSEDFAMLELYVDGKLVDQWNDYFGANVTGNPLQQKFIDMAKKNGVDPIGLKVIDGEDGNEGVFTSSGLKWNSTEAKAKSGHNARAMARAQDIIRKSIEQSQKNADKKDDKKDRVKEAVTLDYSRHMRSHGRKPRDPGYSALWMFTTREYGMPDDDEIFKFQGSFTDAKKAAAKWAKSQDAYRVYVME